MDYAEALEVGAGRSADAAERLGKATGLPTQRVCAVKHMDPSGAREKPHAWSPVGKENFSDVAFFTHREASANALVLLVDSDGDVKACSSDFLPVRVAIEMAKSLRFPVSRWKGSYLAKVLEAEDLTEQVRGSTLRIDM